MEHKETGFAAAVRADKEASMERFGGVGSTQASIAQSKAVDAKARAEHDASASGSSNVLANMHIRKFRQWVQANAAKGSTDTIIKGDDTRYWVVSKRDGAKLEKLGYEEALD